MAFRVVAVALVIALGVASAAPTWAAEGKQVGEYTVAVRWEHDPPVAGYLNAVLVQVTRGNAGVPGLERSLTAEVRTQGSGGRTLTLYVTPTAGLYRAPVIPTDARSYEVRLSGTLGTTPLELSFTKADGLSDPLQPSTVAYPGESLPDRANFFDSQLVGLNGKAVASQQDAEDARAIANDARTITVLAAVLAFLAMTVAAVTLGVATYWRAAARSGGPRG